MILLTMKERPDPNFLLDMLLEAAYPPGSHPDRSTASQEPRIRQWLDGFGERHGDLAMIAYDGVLPVGAAWCRLFDTSAIGMVGITNQDTPSLAVGVYPRYRQQGVGSALLEALCNECRDAGFNAISLAVGRSNPALRLYNRLGFEVVSEEPVIVMKRVL
jgi:ribosomal protein S18 acetylase RimI-like enzyme